MALGTRGRLREEVTCLRLVGKLVQLDGPCECHPRCQPGEANLDELLRVERTMPVTAPGYRLWKDDARSIRCLKEAAAVDTTGDFLDKHLRVRG